jgi:hypothetical protein
MSDRVRAELLREWRLAQQLDVTAVAREANLSVAQIHQLETQGTSLFYSPAIKESAARKVALLLGGDPAQVVAEDASKAVNAPPYAPERAVVGRMLSYPAGGRGFNWRWPRQGRWGLGAILLLGGIVWAGAASRAAHMWLQSDDAALAAGHSAAAVAVNLGEHLMPVSQNSAPVQATQDDLPLKTVSLPTSVAARTLPVVGPLKASVVNHAAAIGTASLPAEPERSEDPVAKLE